MFLIVIFYLCVGSIDSQVIAFTNKKQVMYVTEHAA